MSESGTPAADEVHIDMSSVELETHTTTNGGSPAPAKEAALAVANPGEIVEVNEVDGGGASSMAKANDTSELSPKPPPQFLYQSSILSVSKHASLRGNVSLSWHELEVIVPPPQPTLLDRIRGREPTGTEKRILKKVNGKVEPGQLVAIMGASGAGKTTFLNALSGRTGAKLIVNGAMKINQTVVSPYDIKKISAYVQQQDLFFATLTVREHLLFQALLRMDNRMTEEDRGARVDEVIQELGLKKCQNTLIGSPTGIRGISGGEMKRLSFASEILMDPPLLFVDEPSSGLDSFMAQSVVKGLQDMANMGRTILCTIHQPPSEVFSMFNRLLLFAEGKTAFLGNRDDALPFFREMQHPCPPNYNPADFYIYTLAIIPQHEEESRERVKVFTDEFEKRQQAQLAIESAEAKKERKLAPIDLKAVADFYGETRGTQFNMVMWRTWLTTKREPQLTKVRFMQTLIIGLFVGLLFLQVGGTKQSSVQNVSGVLFFLVIQQSFGTIFPIVQVFPEEKSIFLRDNDNRMYKTWIYFLSKTIAEIPFQIFLPFLFTAISYFMVNLNNDADRFFLFVLILILSSTAAQSLGYLISALVPSVSVALAVTPVIVIPFMLFGGLFINSDDIPKYFIWLEYISWIKYGFEASMVNEFDGRTLDTSSCVSAASAVGNDSTPARSRPCFLNGQQVLDYYKLDKDNVTQDIFILIGLAIGFRIISYLIMELTIYQRSKHTRRQG